MAIKKGRKPLSKIEKSRRAAARAYLDLQNAEYVLVSLMNLGSRFSLDERAELREIASIRLNLVKQIEVARKLRIEARARGDAAMEIRIDDHKKQLHVMLRQCPPLGITRKEAVNLPQSVHLGQPAKTPEAKYLKAKEECDKALSYVAYLEQKEGVPPFDVEAYSEIVSAVKSGRPRNNSADDLLRSIGQIEEEIAAIESGKVAKERREILLSRIRHRKLASPDDLPAGRPFADLRDRLSRLRSEHEALYEKYILEFNKLSNEERFTHVLKSLRRKLRRIEAELPTASGSDRIALTAQSEALRYEIETLCETSETHQREKIKASRATMRQARLTNHKAVVAKRSLGPSSDGERTTGVTPRSTARAGSARQGDRHDNPLID